MEIDLFFMTKNGKFFHVVVKKIITLFKNNLVSFTIVKCSDFSGYHDYLEDPPWLGPTRKKLKKGDSKIG